jgi:hypothetical protein
MRTLDFINVYDWQKNCEDQMLIAIKLKKSNKKKGTINIIGFHGK